VISRDVKICENEAWDWNMKEKSSSHTVPTIIEEDDQGGQVQLDVEVQPEVNVEEIQATGTSTRQRFASTRLAGHEVTPDNLVNEEGEFVHFALLADAEPINYEVALNEDVYKNAMIKELNSINRNNT